MPHLIDRQGHWRPRLVAALCLTLVAWGASAVAQQLHLLDGFEDLALWQADASDGVRASLYAVEGREGQALCIEFDFAGAAGYAIARRTLPIDFPPNYEFSFYVRGDAPVNNLELKLIDASGDNVWWVNRRDFAFPREWQQVRLKKRHIEFAWGPTPDRTLKHSAALELVLKAGRLGVFRPAQLARAAATNHDPPYARTARVLGTSGGGSLLCARRRALYCLEERPGCGR
jgi:hypothetical protein